MASMGKFSTEVTMVAVMAALCMLGRGVAGSPFCGVDSRPVGLCGSALLIARKNLCELLSRDYPEIFAINRRADQSLDIPSDILEKLDQQDLPAGDLSDSQISYFSALLTGKMDTDDGPYFLPGEEHKRGDTRPKVMSSVDKRGLNCDCCFNVCRPSVMARYC